MPRLSKRTDKPPFCADTTPPMHSLVASRGQQVDWTEERTCFEGIAAELALYYSTLPQDGQEEGTTSCSPEDNDGRRSSSRPRAEAAAGASGADGGVSGLALAPAAATAVVQHVMYPSFRWGPYLLYSRAVIKFAWEGEGNRSFSVSHAL